MLKASRQDVAAPVLSGVAFPRRTLAALLAGAVTHLGGLFRQDTDARDKRKPVMGRRRGGARNERLLSVRIPGRNNLGGATVSRSPVRSAVGNRDQALLVDRRKFPLARIVEPSTPDEDTAPRHPHRTPDKRQRREKRREQERERHHATKKTTKEKCIEPRTIRASTPPVQRRKHSYGLGSIRRPLQKPIFNESHLLGSKRISH